MGRNNDLMMTFVKLEQEDWKMRLVKNAFGIGESEPEYVDT